MTLSENTINLAEEADFYKTKKSIADVPKLSATFLKNKINSRLIYFAHPKNSDKTRFKEVLNLIKYIKVLPIWFFLFLACCYGSNDLAKEGRVSLYNSQGKSFFVFYIHSNQASSSYNNEDPSKTSKAENKLLASLLKQKGYCLNKKGDPWFTITSYQEKIYDMTYAHLIEQNYKIRPSVPRVYFGQCNKKEEKSDKTTKNYFFW